MTINFMNCIIELYNNNDQVDFNEILFAVLEQECDINLQIASEQYKEKLS